MTSTSPDRDPSPRARYSLFGLWKAYGTATSWPRENALSPLHAEAFEYIQAVARETHESIEIRTEGERRARAATYMWLIDIYPEDVLDFRDSGAPLEWGREFYPARPLRAYP